MSRGRRKPPVASGMLWALLSACPFAGVVGCDPPETRFDLVGDFVQRDSAGVLISVTGGAPARASLGWEIERSPDLVLGTRAVPAHRFHEIDGVRQLSSGQVLVVERGSRQLKFFDQNGTLIYRTGRPGEGPGEFGEPVLVPGSSDDSVLVWDVRLVRLNIYSHDGRAHRLIRPDSWAGGRPPLGVATSASQALVDQSASPLLVPHEPGVWERTEVYSWIDLVSGRRTTIDSAIVRSDYRSVSPGGVPIVLRIPFSPRSSAVVRGTEAWLTEGSTAEIRVYDLDGRLTHILRIDERRRPVTHEDLLNFIELKAGGAADSEQSWQTVYSDVPIPDSMPAFESLLVDEVRLVWVGRYNWDPAAPREWVVFNGDGRALGSVTTPPQLDIHQVGVDFILGVASDSLGVERVERYALQRGGASTPPSPTPGG